MSDPLPDAPDTLATLLDATARIQKQALVKPYQQAAEEPI